MEQEKPQAQRRSVTGWAWRADWRVTVGIVLAGVVLFGPSVNDGFHFDDELILVDSNVTNPGRWSHFLNPLRLRQVTFFSFYLNHLWHGDDAVGYHLVNIGLHIANAVLFYYLLGPLVGGWPAGAASLLFLSHPVQTEPVVYIYQRSTLLAVFFSLGALCVLRAATREAKSGLSRSRLAVIVMLFILAAWSKESALAVPLLLVLFLGLGSRYTPLVLIAVGSGAVGALGLLAWLGEQTVGIGALDDTSSWTYFLTEVKVVYTYGRLLVFGFPQALEYDIAPASSVWEPAVALGLVGIALMVWGSWKLYRSERFRWAGIGALSFWILLWPTSSFVPSRDFAFEHRLYLPMLGFAVFLAFWMGRLRQRTALITVLLLVWSGLTLNRGRVWASDVRLWEDTVQKAPGKVRAWFNLGGAYMEAGDPRAREAFLQVVEMDSGFTEALYNLGLLEERSGNSLEALSWYERALATDETYWPAVHNTGNVKVALGDMDGAIVGYERTLDLNPDYWPAQYNLGIVYSRIDRPDLAVPRLRSVLEWEPDFAEARYLLALSLERLGEEEAAADELEQLGSNGRERFAGVEAPPLLEGIR